MDSGGDEALSTIEGKGRFVAYAEFLRLAGDPGGKGDVEKGSGGESAGERRAGRAGGGPGPRSSFAHGPGYFISGTATTSARLRSVCGIEGGCLVGK